MAVATNAISVSLGLSSAPLIEGAPSATYNSDGGGVGFSNSVASTGRRGCRIALAGVTDFTTHTHVGFGMYTSAWDIPSFASSVETGGVRVIFVDALGSYAGFNVYGKGIPDYSDGNGGVANGFFASYVGILSSGRPVSWQIARTAPPAISGGTIDWSQVVAIEISINKAGSANENLYIGGVRKLSNIVATGVVSLASIFSSVNDAGGAIGDLQHWVGTAYISQSASVRILSAKMGFDIGNGVTPTNFVTDATAFGFFNTYDKSPAYRSTGPLILLGADKARRLRIIQSGSDMFALTDSTIASAAYWQWELSGSGVATCTRVQFWRFDGFKAAHGSYVDCAWNNADTAVEVTAATVISGGLIRGAKTTALKILGAQGVYSGLSLKIDSAAATYDIELGSGGAGTYELLNISVPSGYTLRLRNNSATNSVVVKLPLGLAYSASTAGGAMSVQIPAISVTIEAPALISGSRVQLYNQTDGVELLNIELASAGLALSLPYTGNKIVRLRADHNSKLPLETAGVLTASGLTFLDVQSEDDVYLGNAVDGSLVTEFIPDSANIQVDINDPDGITAVQRLYAWMQWYMTTEAGVRSDFFGAMFAIDSANYQIDQAKADIKLDNVSPMPVRVVGGNLTRRDGSTVIAATSGSIQMDPGKAYAIETGVSGLTIDESNKLNAISTLALEATAQAVKSHTTTLVARPVPPTTAQVVTGVWADPAAAALALETTSQQLLAGGAATDAKVDALIARPAPTAAPTAAQVASAVRVEVAPELVRVVELAKVHGLVPGSSLVVSPTSRTAGDVSQTISEAGGVTTVARA